MEELRSPRLLAHPSLRGEGPDAAGSPTGHELHVGKTFACSYDRLNPMTEAGACTRALLLRTSFFAPGIPVPRTLVLRALLVSTRGAARDDLDDLAGTAANTPHAAKTMREAEDALWQALSLGLLVEGKEETLVMHRLVATFVRQTPPQTPQERNLWYRMTARFARQIIPDELTEPASEEALIAEAAAINEAGYPLEMRVLLPHLLAMADRIQQRARRDARAAQLLNTLGVHWYQAGDYAAARPLHERALAIREQVLGPDHPDTAGSLNNLALLLDAQGDYAAARPLYERALAIQEQALGPDHPHTAQSLNNLALLLDAQGDYAAARPLYERALAICEQALGPEHPFTAGSLNNLAGLLEAQGDYAAARPLLERALAIQEQALGPHHPDTAGSLNNLAWLCHDEAQYGEAAALMRRALAIWEAVLGPGHPHTQAARRSLAVIEAKLGGAGR